MYVITIVSILIRLATCRSNGVVISVITSIMVKPRLERSIEDIKVGMQLDMTHEYCSM